MADPIFLMTVAGSSYNWKANRVQFTGLDLFAKDRWQEFSFFVAGGALLAAGADPFKGKAILVDIDCQLGAGSVRRFTGRCVDGEYRYGEFGWGRYYVCYDLRWLGDKVPHTDSVTGLDTSTFNAAADNPDSMFLAGRLGRTQGQILQAILDMPSNNADLTAMGVGAYNSAGSGGAGTAAIAAGAVTGIAITSAGMTYTSAPTVYLNGGGGSGATATATVSGGLITGFTITAGGTGYTSPPEVIISALPLATIRDLAQMSIVLPYPVEHGGEKALEALSATLRRIAPCHMLLTKTDGTLRFFDTRAFAGPIVSISDGTGSGATGTAVVSVGGFVSAITVGSGGSGYSGSPVVTIIGGGGFGATATAVVVAGAITAFSMTNSGSGYSKSITLTMDQLDASGRLLDVNILSWRASSEHCFGRIVIRGQPLVVGAWVATALPPGGGGSGATATATRTADAITALNVTAGGTLYVYPPNVTITGGGGSGALYTANLSGGIVVSFTKVSGGSGYTSTPTVTISTENGLAEAFDHDGLTTNQAKNAFHLNANGTTDGSAGQAIVTATVSSGAVNGYSVQFGGYNYGSAPVLHFSGGGGTGATATAVLTNGVVTSITPGSGGSGYTSAPTIVADLPAGGNADAGTCTCPTSTTLTLTSVDARRVLPANYWDQSASGRKGFIYAVSPGSVGLTTTFNAPILSHTALTAGGTYTVTIGLPLPNLNFTAYRIVGTTGGQTVTWCRYKVLDLIKSQHMAPRFNVPVPMQNSDGTAATLTSTPAMRILYSSTGQRPYFEAPWPATFDPATGYITAAKPTVCAFGTTANLIAGGAQTDGIPASVEAFLALYSGVLSVTYPPDTAGPTPHYLGTANTQLSLTDTLKLTVPGWRDPSNMAAMTNYAAELLDTVKDEAYDLSLEIIGLYEELWDCGRAININSATGYPTGLEAVALPILECSLKWSVGDGAKFRTHVKASNRKAQYTAERYLHPTPTGLMMGGGPDEGFSAGAGLMDLGGMMSGNPGGAQMGELVGASHDALSAFNLGAE